MDMEAAQQVAHGCSTMHSYNACMGWQCNVTSRVDLSGIDRGVQAAQQHLLLLPWLPSPPDAKRATGSCCTPSLRP